MRSFCVGYSISRNIFRDVAATRNTLIRQWKQRYWTTRVKLNYMWLVEMNWIPAKAVVISRVTIAVDSLRPHKYLCNIYDRLMRGAAENRYTRIPPKAIRALYFRHFLRPTLADMPYCHELPPPSPAANIPMAITRIMSTWFFIAHECGYVNAITQNKMTFIYFIHGN